MTEVTDEVLGRFARQQNDWFRRVRDGSLDPEEVYRAINPLVQRGGPAPAKEKQQRKKKLITPSMITLHLFDRAIEFWRVVGGLILSNAKFALPTLRSGQEDFILPLIKPLGLTNESLYALDAKLFPSWKSWDNLNLLEVKEPYLQVVDQAPVILVKQVVEASDDLQMSYNQAVAEKKIFISIGQCLIMEAFGFWLNKDHPSEAKQFGIPRHFDPKGWTRTASLAPDGGVADGGWREANGRFGVSWSARADAGPCGGIRQAVL